MTQKTFTIFCRESNGTGTTWVQAVQAKDLDAARAKGRTACAADWEYDEDDIAVVGVAKGSVTILDWDDEV